MATALDGVATDCGVLATEDGVNNCSDAAKDCNRVATACVGAMNAFGVTAAENGGAITQPDEKMVMAFEYFFMDLLSKL